jgi:hypothetical protein
LRPGRPALFIAEESCLRPQGHRNGLIHKLVKKGGIKSRITRIKEIFLVFFDFWGDLGYFGAVKREGIGGKSVARRSWLVKEMIPPEADKCSMLD